ncbi:MAG: DNA-binding response regulator [Acidobacteria bacterium]|jgi:DNA-binding winged helix-turn-helix (wHTH) protein|nr:MAG: DNA-binding response regulator [Acidobacteriota bacterium]
MANESSLNFRYPQRMGQRTRQEFMPINPHDRDRELSFSEITKEIGTNSAPGDNPRHPLALPNMFESDNYQVALVRRREWETIRKSSAEPVFAAGPAVLLPFSWKELIARVLEFVRDSDSQARRNVARFADICIDFTRMKVSRSSGEPIPLTVQEFKTLKCFLSNPDRVFSRGELLNEAWGYQDYPETRTVDNHVLKLRQKLEKDPARPVHFRTVHRVGYRFVP